MVKRLSLIVVFAALLLASSSAYAQNLGSIGILNLSKVKHQEWQNDFKKKYEIRGNHVFDKFNNVGYGQVAPDAFIRIIEDHIKKAYRKLPVPVDAGRDKRFAIASEQVENAFIIELDSQIIAEISTSDLNVVKARGVLEGKISVYNTTSNKVLDRIEIEVSEDIEDEFHMTRGFARPIDRLKEKLLEELRDEIRDLEPDLYRAPRFDPIIVGDYFISKKQYLKAYEIFSGAAKNNIKRKACRQRMEMLGEQYGGMKRRVVGIAYIGKSKISPDMIGLPEITSLADQEIDGYRRTFGDQFSDIMRKGFEETFWLINGAGILAVVKQQVEQFYGVEPVIIAGDDNVMFRAQEQYVDDLILVDVLALVHAKYGVGVAKTKLSGVIKGINTQTENTVFTIPVDFEGDYSERDSDYKKWSGRDEVDPPGVCHFARHMIMGQVAEVIKGLDHNFGAEQKMDILFKAREYDQKGKKIEALALLTRWWDDNGKNVRQDIERLQIEAVGAMITKNNFSQAYQTLNDFSAKFPNTRYMDKVEEYQNFLSMANSISEIEQTAEGYMRAIDMWKIFIRKFPRSKLVSVARREIAEYERKIAASRLH
jgi:hypothetical protein